MTGKKGSREPVYCTADTRINAPSANCGQFPPAMSYRLYTAMVGSGRGGVGGAFASFILLNPVLLTPTTIHYGRSAATMVSAGRDGVGGALAKANGYTCDETTCKSAAEDGYLELLQWLRNNGCP